jgi:rare lipoprotein A
MAQRDRAPGGWQERPARFPTLGEASCWRTLIAAAAVVALAGCAGTPKPGSGPYAAGRDGPMPHTPADLDRVPDVEPRIEPLRVGGPNKPYEINGRRYEPEARDVPLKQRGLASWYGRKFHGRRTANGEVYDMFALTAAHPTMPLPSYAIVRNPANGREIVVRVNDRGPFHPGRIIDLSYTAALKLDLLRGVAPVEVERITHEAIRTGEWRRDTRFANAHVPAPAAVTVPATSVVPVVASSASRPPPVSLPAGRSAGASHGAPAAATATPAVATASPAVATASPAVTTAAPPVATASPAAATGSPAVAAASPAVAAAMTAPGAVATTPPGGTPVGAPTELQPPGFWVQLGVFRQPEGASSFRHQVAREVDWVAPMLAVFRDSDLHRLQAGPYASRDDANAAADRLREALRLVPVIVERP